MDARHRDLHLRKHSFPPLLSSDLASPARGAIWCPPFYAIELVPGDVGTSGGVVTDASARVLRDDGSPIDGLYATGTSAASVMGRYAPGAGASIGPSLLWAYVAAKQIGRASCRGRGCQYV